MLLNKNIYVFKQSLPQNIKDLINDCLQIHSLHRKTPEDILKLPIFEDYIIKDAKDKEDSLYENIITRTMDELYYLWQLAGGDMFVELKRQGLIRSRPPILTIPK